MHKCESYPQGIELNGGVCAECAFSGRQDAITIVPVDDDEITIDRAADVVPDDKYVVPDDLELRPPPRERTRTTYFIHNRTRMKLNRRDD